MMRREHYIVTCSGRKFSLTNPRAEQVSLSDIWRTLGNLSRFGGHTSYTVAEHSRWVAVLAVPPAGVDGCDFATAALYHDAHEAYIGDITTPVARELSQMIGDGGDIINMLKARVQAAIHEAVGLPWPLPESWTRAIKEADNLAMIGERDRYLTKPVDGWGWLWPDGGMDGAARMES